MPKIIDNGRLRILEEAHKILTTEGYAALTIRRTAQDLGIGVGTIYNYFPSKVYLTAAVMLEDWDRMTASLDKETPASPEETLETIFDLLGSYCRRYRSIWEEYGKQGGIYTMPSRYTEVLTGQLTGWISRSLPPAQAEAEPYLSAFLAEIILRFAPRPGASFEDIRLPVRKLLR